MKILTSMIAVLFLLTACTVNATDYFYNNQAVIVQQKRVEFDPRYYLGLNGYYAVGEQIKEEKHHEKLDELTKQNIELKAYLDAIIKILQETGKLPQPPAIPEPQPPVVPEPPKEDDLTTQINTLFKSKCYNCHRTDNNGLKMFNDQGKVEVSLADAVNIHYRVEGLGFEEGVTIMPKGGKSLTNDEMVLVKKWLYKISQGE